MTCPRCHKQQPASQECAYCGIVLFKHYKKSDQENLSQSPMMDDSAAESSSEMDGLHPKAEKDYPGKSHHLSPKLIIGGSIALAVVLLVLLISGNFFSIGKMSTEDLVAETEDAVALITHDRGNGSGFIIAENLLATNYHVIENVFPEDLELYFPAESNESIEVGNVVYFDESRDIALIEIDYDRMPLPISTGTSLRHGEDLVIIGNPGISGDLILKNSVTRGTLNSENKILGQKYLQISASINPGNSGGPALNYKGAVVAIITLKASKQEGITFGIPLSEIVPTLEELEEFSEDDRIEANDHFIACSLFKRLSEYATVNLVAMDLYIEGMNRAIDLNMSANDGLNIVAKEIDQTVSVVNNWISPSKIDKYLRQIHQSEYVEDVIKENLLELWICTKEIRDYVDYPRGNLRTYTQKRNALYDRYGGIEDILRIRLNVGES